MSALQRAPRQRRDAWKGARMGLLLLLALAAAIAPAGDAAALEPPAGPAVLTVTGAVAKPNRGAFDIDADLLIDYFDRSFDKAAAFDLTMLEALPSREISLAYEAWPQPVRLSGPLLRDVLAAAGAAAEEGIAVLALDGFAIELSAADLAAQDWIVALKRDGRPLDIGGRGPLWLVYARRDGKPANADDEARWPWGVFLIEVKERPE